MTSKTTSCFAIILLLIISSSCTVPKAFYSGGKINNPQKIAVVSTMIDEYDLLDLPLTDVATINPRTKRLSAQIMERQEKVVDSYREIIAKEFKNNFKCEVLYGESLHQEEGYGRIQQQMSYEENLNIKNKHFPKIITATGDVNPFPIEYGNIEYFFKEPSKYKYPIYMLAKELDSDLIVVSHSNLSTICNQYTIYYVRLDTYIYIFNKMGERLAKSHTYSDQIPMKGKDIEDYQKALDSFESVANPIIREIVQNIKQ